MVQDQPISLNLFWTCKHKVFPVFFWNSYLKLIHHIEFRNTLSFEPWKIFQQWILYKEAIFLALKAQNTYNTYKLKQWGRQILSTRGLKCLSTFWNHIPVDIRSKAFNICRHSFIFFTIFQYQEFEDFTYFFAKLAIWWTLIIQVIFLFLLTKAMKSSPLLGPFCGSEFWRFSLLKIKLSWVFFMFQTSDNCQLCIDSQNSSQ
jgi:hypothetical protein